MWSRERDRGREGHASKGNHAGTAKTAADYTASTTERAKNYALQKAAQTKDVVVDAGETTVHYVREKAVGAKDSTLETGKHVVEHAEKAAVGLKDKAKVAGWTAAHYSCEKAVEGTKAAASAVKGAAKYAGHKAPEIDVPFGKSLPSDTMHVCYITPICGHLKPSTRVSSHEASNYFNLPKD
jgi:hypothetical protein